MFLKYRELLSYGTLYENIERKIHILKKPTAGDDRIWRSEKKVNNPLPLDKGGLSIMWRLVSDHLAGHPLTWRS